MPASQRLTRPPVLSPQTSRPHTPPHLPAHPPPVFSPPQAAYSNGRIYVADRIDVVDPPLPPDPDYETPGDGAPESYSPRPAVYWAWVQPTFTAYGPCACYWNFNWGWVWAWGRAGAGGQGKAWVAQNLSR
jgi:hypothetical protein